MNEIIHKLYNFKNKEFSQEYNVVFVPGGVTPEKQITMEEIDNEIQIQKLENKLQEEINSKCASIPSAITIRLLNISNSTKTTISYDDFKIIKRFIPNTKIKLNTDGVTIKMNPKLFAQEITNYLIDSSGKGKCHYFQTSHTRAFLEILHYCS